MHSDLRLHEVLFCDYSVGEAEVTIEISLKYIEVNCSFFLDLDGVPFRHILCKIRHFFVLCFKGFCSSPVFDLRV